MRLGLPHFLHWSLENEHPSAASLHLEFLYQDFLLCQTFMERTGNGSNSLIDKSREIMVLLLDIVSKQTRAGNVSHFTIFDVSGLSRVLRTRFCISANSCYPSYATSVYQLLASYRKNYSAIRKNLRADYRENQP